MRETGACAITRFLNIICIAELEPLFFVCVNKKLGKLFLFWLVVGGILMIRSLIACKHRVFRNSAKLSHSIRFPITKKTRSREQPVIFHLWKRDP